MLQANPKKSHPPNLFHGQKKLASQPPKRPEECLKAQDLDVAWEITDLRGLCQCCLHEQWQNPGCLRYIGDYTTQLI